MAKKVLPRKRVIRDRAQKSTKKPSVGRQRRATATPPASNQRIAPTIARVTVPKTKLVPGAKVTFKKMTVRPPFQLPFKCGQTWRASTYDGHYPDQDSLDLLRFDGATNISAGEDVLASAAGTVIEAHDTNSEDPPYGSVVTIEHEGDWKTQYIHLDDALSVKKDDKIGRGQKIGTVGGNIKIFGTANAHRHYTQWFGSSGVRAVFNGVATAVHAGAKDANGNYPTENIVSANCPVLVQLVAIDPLALILSNEVYVKIHLPDPPPIPLAFRELVKGLSSSDRKLARERARRLGEYVKSIENALGGPDT